jgi:hypothetical protein
VANLTAPHAGLGHDLFYGLEKEVSMSLKFAAVGSLTVLSPFQLPARGDDRARKVVLGESYDPLLAMLGTAIKGEQRLMPKKKPLTAHAHRRYTFAFRSMRLRTLRPSAL